MRPLRLLLIAACVGVCVTPLRAQTPTAAPPATATQAVSPEKEKAIRQLMAVMGMPKLMDQMMTQMMAPLRTSMPDLPPAYWDKMQARMKSSDLITLLIPVYDKYYTQDDLNGLLAFYQSPLGQKVISVTPQISRESMTIGQAWGRKQALAVIREMQQEENASRHKAQSQ